MLLNNVKVTKYQKQQNEIKKFISEKNFNNEKFNQNFRKSFQNFRKLFPNNLFFNIVFPKFSSKFQFLKNFTKICYVAKISQTVAIAWKFVKTAAIFSTFSQNLLFLENFPNL